MLNEGLDEFLGILKAKNKVDGKRPQSCLEFAFWRAAELRAGGYLDMKQSSQEMANDNGFNCI